ncbi:P-loop containing nucleoside triphosphate hydrolase protein [Dichotomopilus funicola]|uniref:P-loop containing nucleoside triphosphate hydrolase protein n=1 Tax=Dichotomopilus funicola TaxID=1934379 RepID=A0AAN6V7L6_9PEZI|nr:P-loop containing nucleoside triphosphate hydrolase protein [Dichotomopilus funicola]
MPPTSPSPARIPPPTRARASKNNTFSASLQCVSPTWDGPNPDPDPVTDEPPATASAPTGVKLRDYQEECIQTVLAAFEQGHKRIGISLATGSGKTVPRSELATQTLIVAHRRELVEQAARHCSNTYPDQTVELELGKLAASGTADITVASLQSILSRDRYLKFDPDRFKLVLVDEAHHIVAPGYLKLLEHMGLRHKQANSPNLVGVSATFGRFDGVSLGAVIDEIVYHKDYVDMISEKWLSDVLFTTVKSNVDLSQVRRKGKGGSGEFETDSLSRAVNTTELNDVVVRTWFAKAANRKSTLVFCVDLNHLTSLTQRFRHYGVDARFVTGDTPTRERAERLDAFKNGEYPVLVNCGVFTEGTDIPNIDCVLLARPTRSRNLLIQMIGRGMRLHNNKKDCHVIDMVAGLEAGIVSTPTLFGLDPDELVSEVTAEEMYELADRKEAELERESRAKENLPADEPASQRSYNVTFTEYDSIFDLISDSSGEKHVRSISRLAWVQISPDKYILNGSGKTYLKIERVPNAGPDEPQYKAFEVRELPSSSNSKSPYAAPREVLSAHTFVDAIHGCDKYASEKYPFFVIGAFLNWRKDPATPGQLKFLNQLRGTGEELGPNDITKGAAGDMIIKLRHGARGRFAALEAARKRQVKLAAIDELNRERKLNEVVSVGPLNA